MTKRYAIIENGYVVNIALADAPVNENWIDLTDVNPQPSIYWAYSNGVFTAPEEVITPSAHEWFIDIGPFYDRFGAVKMEILTSDNSTIKAILEDIKIRKWIDLKNPLVIQSLAYISSVVPALTAELQSAILNTPVSDMENMALRKLYF